MLNNKKIALYVTGGIAVYKAVELLRELIKRGADVRVSMTEGATQFVSPLTFQVLSKNEVHLETFSEKNPEIVQHIHLADWADYSILAPATANTIAKIANGIGDNFVSSALLATSPPIFVVPAMNTKMYENKATQLNMRFLMEHGSYVMEPDTGFLAEGYEGKGRYPETKRIMSEFEDYIIDKEKFLPLKGKKVLVTAGGTVERIDPVRYITNDSSGKMGHAIAKAAHYLGAEVTLVTSSSLEVTHSINVIPVTSTDDMFEAVDKYFDESDILVMAAAVSDYKPKNTSEQKMKKQDETTIELIKNPDILKAMGKRKNEQILIGFAAETENLEKYAKTKLVEKKLDAIVANDVSKEGQGFNSDENEVIIFSNDQEPIHIELTSKENVADEILSFLTGKLD